MRLFAQISLYKVCLKTICQEIYNHLSFIYKMIFEECIRVQKVALCQFRVTFSKVVHANHYTQMGWQVSFGHTFKKKQ